MQCVKSLRKPDASSKILTINAYPFKEEAVYLVETNTNEEQKQVEKTAFLEASKIASENLENLINSHQFKDVLELVSENVCDDSQKVDKNKVIIDFNEYMIVKEQEIANLLNKVKKKADNHHYSDSPLTKYSDRLKEYSSLKTDKKIITSAVSKNVITVTFICIAIILSMIIILLLNL